MPSKTDAVTVTPSGNSPLRASSPLGRLSKFLPGKKSSSNISSAKPEAAVSPPQKLLAEMSLSHDADISLVSPKHGGRGGGGTVSASDALRALQAQAVARGIHGGTALGASAGKNGKGVVGASPDELSVGDGDVGEGTGGAATTEGALSADAAGAKPAAPAGGAAPPAPGTTGGGSSEISASDDEDGSWIAWFCSLRGNEFFCEVEEDYIQDDFNLTGLNSLVPYYDYALDMVLDVEMPMEDSLTEEQQEIVESAAEMLYGLIHARYIVTNRGMHAMYEKYRSAAFGRCPRVFCQGQPVLPVGLSDLPRNYTVNVFCPRCHGLFFPKSTRQANIDGAYFGTTFPHLFLMTHPDIIPAKPSQNYIPRVYGFKIHQSSVYYRNHEDSQQSENIRMKRSKNRTSSTRLK